jgi:hypothetical protein
MKTAELVLWTLGATLVAVYAGALLWTDYERQEGVTSFVEAREVGQMGPQVDPMLQARVAAGTTTVAAVNVPAPAGDAVIAVLRTPGIERATLERTQFYCTIELSVVDLHDVHVLDDTGEPVLTLVTCHPHFLVDHAPQRFIARAVAAEGQM